jgi:hypothetical protein
MLLRWLQLVMRTRVNMEQSASWTLYLAKMTAGYDTHERDTSQVLVCVLHCQSAKYRPDLIRSRHMMTIDTHEASVVESQ